MLKKGRFPVKKTTLLQKRAGKSSCECGPGYYGDGYLCAIDRYDETFWTQGRSA